MAHDAITACVQHIIKGGMFDHRLIRGILMNCLDTWATTALDKEQQLSNFGSELEGFRGDHERVLPDSAGLVGRLLTQDGIRTMCLTKSYPLSAFTHKASKHFRYH
jgi:hypothetical protein